MLLWAFLTHHQEKNILYAGGCSVPFFGHKLAISVIFQHSVLCSALGCGKHVGGVIMFSYNSYVHSAEQKAGMSDFSSQKMQESHNPFPVFPGSELDSVF